MKRFAAVRTRNAIACAQRRPTFGDHGRRRRAGPSGNGWAGDVARFRCPCRDARLLGCERRLVVRLHFREWNTVLRSLGARETRDHGREIERQRVAEDRIGRRVSAEESLRLGVRLHQRDVVLVAPAEPQILECLVIAREKAHGGAVLGAHVGDRRAVGERERRQPAAVVLDELSDDLLVAEHLRAGEYQVRGRRARRQSAVELEADDLGDEHRDGLAEHRRFGFDSADAPAKHAEAVDHRRVGVGADERIAPRRLLAALLAHKHHLTEVLEVHLVADAGSGRHHAKVGERLLPPAEKLVALEIPLVFERCVEQHRRVRTVFVDLHRMVDYQIDGLQWVDARGLATEGGDRIAHGGEIHHAGHAGEVLEEHARRAERDLAIFGPFHVPRRHRAHIVLLHERAVLVAQQVLEQNLKRKRQASYGAAGERGERVEPIDRVVLSVDREGRPGVKAVLRWHVRISDVRPAGCVRAG